MVQSLSRGGRGSAKIFRVSRGIPEGETAPARRQAGEVLKYRKNKKN